MGNYAHLFASDSEFPNYTLKEDNICLQAKYLIPAFWSLLFDSQSYRYVIPVTEHDIDPEETPGPFCTMDITRALDLYQQREEKLFELIPSKWRDLSASFVEFLESKPRRYLQLDLGDLASMIGDAAFEGEVKRALDDLNQAPIVSPSGLLAKYRKPKISNGWSSLLGLAGINPKKLDEVNYWDLAGVGEAERAPWEEN